MNSNGPVESCLWLQLVQLGDEAPPTHVQNAELGDAALQLMVQSQHLPTLLSALRGSASSKVLLSARPEVFRGDYVAKADENKFARYVQYLGGYTIGADGQSAWSLFFGARGC